MLNILPRISGFFIAPHLKVSYSVAVELADIAFINGMKIRREVSTHPKEAGLKSLTISDGGLRILLERLHDRIDIWIFRNGSAEEVLRDITDMREPLGRLRTVTDEYQRPRRAWWAVVPTDQYSFTKFL